MFVDNGLLEGNQHQLEGGNNGGLAQVRHKEPLVPFPGR